MASTALASHCGSVPVLPRLQMRTIRTSPYCLNSCVTDSADAPWTHKHSTALHVVSTSVLHQRHRQQPHSSHTAAAPLNLALQSPDKQRSTRTDRGLAWQVLCDHGAPADVVGVKGGQGRRAAHGRARLVHRQHAAAAQRVRDDGHVTAELLEPLERRDVRDGHCARWTRHAGAGNNMQATGQGTQTGGQAVRCVQCAANCTSAARGVVSMHRPPPPPRVRSQAHSPPTAALRVLADLLQQVRVRWQVGVAKVVLHLCTDCLCQRRRTRRLTRLACCLLRAAACGPCCRHAAAGTLRSLAACTAADRACGDSRRPSTRCCACSNSPVTTAAGSKHSGTAAGARRTAAVCQPRNCCNSAPPLHTHTCPTVLTSRERAGTVNTLIQAHSQ
jgi:hypothetical protein